MKKRLLYYVFLTTYLFKVDKLFPINRKQKSEIDPITDLRSPHSLTELIHEGLIECDSLLRKALQDEPSTISQTLGQAQKILNSMHNSFDTMIDKSKLHEIYHDDRDFLQNLIDKIDNLIKELEHTKGSMANTDIELLHENSELLHLLTQKLG